MLLILAIVDLIIAIIYVEEEKYNLGIMFYILTILCVIKIIVTGSVE